MSPEGRGFSMAADPAESEQWVIVALSQDALNSTLLLKAEHEMRSPKITTLIE
jgi:hypothetical protein